MSCPSSNFLQEEYSKQQDVVSFAFDTQVQYSENVPLYVDAENPSWSLNLKQVRELVQTLIAGFQGIGIEKGDTVVVQLPNTVRLVPRVPNETHVLNRFLLRCFTHLSSRLSVLVLCMSAQIHEVKVTKSIGHYKSQTRSG